MIFRAFSFVSAGADMPPLRAWLKQLAVILAVAVVALGLLLFLVTPAREYILGKLRGEQPAPSSNKDAASRPALIKDEQGHDGLRVSTEAIASLEIKPVA